MFESCIAPKDLEKLPLESFSGQIEVVDHVGIRYFKAISYLKKQKVLGFDTETRPSFEARHYHHNVALLQLSGPEKAYLFRLNKMGLKKGVCQILADPNIAKIGAASNDDIKGLQQLHPFTPSNFVDLQKIVWEWGIKDKSVKKMTAIILGFRISKNQQLSNWESDVLTDAQQAYAATDAWVCRQMYLKLLKSKKNPLKADE